MIRRTKIIATLGPATEEPSTIRALVDAGMNIARLNFSHGNEKQFKKIVRNLRKAESASGKMVSIMQDLQGPKIRLGALEEPIRVKKGEFISFCAKKKKGCIPLPYAQLSKVVEPGQRLLIEDGLIRTQIVSTKGGVVKVKVTSGGLLQSHKGVNIPDSILPASAALTSKDKADLKFGVKTLKVDAVAISFVERAEDVRRVRKAIARHSKRRVHVVAKIERQEALKNLESIIEEADGIMVARGDLGIETQAERVPIEQKRMLALARQAGKPVIIATQILQSMVHNPLATRAEISDAANAIFEHADAFMLSNETAVGEYPIKAVQTLARVARATEQAIFKDSDLFPTPSLTNPSTVEDESMALTACQLAEQIDAKAIVILTKEGFTARTVLKHRPKTPVIVVTTSKNNARLMNFLWGIRNTLVLKSAHRSEETLRALKQEKILKHGDRVVTIKLSDSKRSLVVMDI